MSMKVFVAPQGPFEKGDLHKPTFGAIGTPAGQAMLESARVETEAQAQARLEKEQADKALFESAVEEGVAARLADMNLPQQFEPTLENMQERMEKLLLEAADQSGRAQAAAAVLEWAAGGDASAEAFDELALGLAGIEDTTDELSDEAIDAYNDQLVMLAEAAIGLGASQDDVTTMIDENDSDSAQAVMDAISVQDEDEAIAAYSVTGGNDGALMESAMLEASIKVVRGGVVKIIRKRPHKVRISGAQRAALKKARLKAQTSTAKIARAKSMKIRKKRGI
ncbi:hypothetical protein UXN85_21025 [Enterobacter hormaechei]